MGEQSKKPARQSNKKQQYKPVKKINKLFSQYNDLENKISLGRTYKYNLEKSFIKIYYDDERLISQSPMLFIPYKPHSNKFKAGLNNEQYICDVDFFNKENDEEIEQFQEWIETLENVVYKLLKKRSYLKIKKKGQNTIIKYDDYRNCSKMTLKLHSQKSKLFRLGGKGEIEDFVKIKDFEGQCYGLFILEFQSVWIKKPIEGIDENDIVQWGIYFTIHGGQTLPNPSRLNPINNIENEFISNPKMLQQLNNINNIPLPPPPPPPLPGLGLPFNNAHIDPILEKKKEVVSKYLKMRSLGVPIPAIHQKMMLDGLEIDWLLHPENIPISWINNGEDIYENTENINGNGSRNINVTSNTNNGEIPKITADMLSSVSLKKRTPEEIETDRIAKEKKRKELLKKKALAGNAPKGFAVDLEDILKIKSRLRTIVNK